MAAAPCRPYILGVTGGVATGKSTVMRLLKARGVTVFSADEAARATLTPEVLEAIAGAFGSEVLLPDGNLDRKRLGEKVFADPQARQTLNRITHPPVLRLLRAQIDAATVDLPGDTLVAVEVPLLYEAGLSDWFDSVLVVSAPEPVQIARLMARNGLTEAEARQRIAAQWPLQDKEARADHVIRNDGAPEQLAAAVDAFIAHIRASTRPGKLPVQSGGPVA
ncbi:MAG: dephospho-CoA kinase [Chloroherpetonaceae bacterium]|nr:dephospho-CoA kinase [Chthonomonadaceae bacterium]MDW8208871.1 dephospho-CoA kinase [Chloroherpetonaceae bacterium]